MKVNRYEIKITGIVQGVGFRPFIYSLARSFFFNGWVTNVSDGVVIEVEADKTALKAFLERIKREAPPLSHIKNITVNEKTYTGYTDFIIMHSSKSEAKNIYISPDVSTCRDCERELLDKNDVRYLYPFINCTNCGPRFTIVTGVPYDRVNTTMRKFSMCDSCNSEYNDYTDRRYHAQPISCHDCGPRLELLDNKCKVVENNDIIGYTTNLLIAGAIIALKGLGGYHLACDAKNENSVKELRRRKSRDDKPFAVMTKDYETALKFCHINDVERKLLQSEKKPIVLLKKREAFDLPKEIAPDNPYLGIMLPYTPVHLLLFNDTHLDTLVMTSGNRSSEPIYYKDNEALEGLKDIADYFLINDREIYIRTDDSVTRVFKDKECILRRSRGYVPLPVTCEAINAKNTSILACGGELKNTFCLNKGDEFYLSHHIGDLENSETLDSFEEGVRHFEKLFDIKYEAVAYDLHPEYLSTKFALALDIQKKFAVQHHHAHIASCMAENNLDGDVIGVAFDGTGYGEDGHIWGGEFFTGGYKRFIRAGHLKYVKMPGGEMAIKEPWRMAVSYLSELDSGINIDGVTFLTDIEANKINTIIQMLAKNINSPMTSSMGRLFDAVAALLGVRSRINYEGQAAIELEYIADRTCCGSYSFSLIDENEGFIVCVEDTIKGIVEDIRSGIPTNIIASKFHETAACIVLEACEKIRAESQLKEVVLSGGVFQNITLLEKSVSKLESSGFEVYIHSKVPSNDGGIALGQAVIVSSTLIPDPLFHKEAFSQAW